MHRPAPKILAEILILSAYFNLLWNSAAFAQDIHFGSIVAFDSSVRVDQLPAFSFEPKPEPATEIGDLGTPHLHAIPALIDSVGNARDVQIESHFGSSQWLPSKIRSRIARTDFYPARLNKKKTLAAVWLTCIYNPPSAKFKGRDVTPRINEAFPCAIPSELAEETSLRTRLVTYVWVSAEIDDQGKAILIRIEDSEADGLQSLISKCLDKWTFSPARRDGRSIKTTLRFPVPLIKDGPSTNDSRSNGLGIAEVRQSSKADVLIGAKLPETPLSLHEWAPVFLPTWCAYFPRFMKAHGGFEVRIGADGRVQDIALASSELEMIKPYIAEGLAGWRFAAPPVGWENEIVPFNVFRVHVNYSPKRNAEIQSPPACVYMPSPVFPESLTFVHSTTASSGATGISFTRPVPLGISSVSTANAGSSRSVTTTVGSTGVSIRKETQLGSLKTGGVQIKFTVTPEGYATNPTILNSTGFAFNAPALLALKSARFLPAQDKEGRNAAATIVDTIMFSTAEDQYASDRFLFSSESTGQEADQGPVLITLAQPVFPAEALEQKLEKGSATVRFRIDASGRVAEVKITNATHTCFGASLRAAVEACRFAPARKAGAAVSVWLTRSEHFTLNVSRPTMNPEQLKTASIAINPEIQAETQIASAQSLDQMPQALHTYMPVFPMGVENSDRTKEVLLDVVIDQNGLVRSPRVVSSPVSELGYSAIQAVSGWLFAPAVKDGQNVACRLRLPIKFTAP